MNALNHPIFIHLPLVLTILLPFLVACGWYLEIKNKSLENDTENSAAAAVWKILAGLMVMATISAMLATATGSAGEEILENTISEHAIEEHEEWGELYAILIYLSTGVSIVHLFLKSQNQLIIRSGLLILSLVITFTGIRTGSLGGELVYKHNGASALIDYYGTGANAPANDSFMPNFEGEGEEDEDDDDD